MNLIVVVDEVVAVYVFLLGPDIIFRAVGGPSGKIVSDVAPSALSDTAIEDLVNFKFSGVGVLGKGWRMVIVGTVVGVWWW